MAGRGSGAISIVQAWMHVTGRIECRFNWSGILRYTSSETSAPRLSVR